jgi:hypothetical protein
VRVSSGSQSDGYHLVEADLPVSVIADWRVERDDRASRAVPVPGEASAHVGEVERRSAPPCRELDDGQRESGIDEPSVFVGCGRATGEDRVARNN